MIWVWVVVTIYAAGDVVVSPGTDLSNWASRAACESALVKETGFGYTAGWEIRTDDAGTRLVREQANARYLVQCFPVYNLDPRTNR